MHDIASFYNCHFEMKCLLRPVNTENFYYYYKTRNEMKFA